MLWLDEIVDKLDSKHNVTQLEVREFFNGNPCSALLKKGIAPVKMFIWRWGKLKLDGISL